MNIKKVKYNFAFDLSVKYILSAATSIKPVIATQQEENNSYNYNPF
jgi:hypothetical protein